MTAASLGTALRRHLPLFGAAIWIAALGLFARAVAAGREILIANEFGVSDTVDALMLALVVPGLLTSVLLGPISAALIPVLVRGDGAGRDESAALSRSVLMLGLAIAVALAVLLAIARGLLVPQLAPDFREPKLDLAEDLLLLLLPTLPAYAVLAFWTAELNARRRYYLAGLAPAVIPLPTIALLLFSPGIPDIRLIGAFFTVGAILAVACLAPAMFSAKLPMIPRWCGAGRGFREFISQYQPLFVATLVSSGLMLTDQVMAARLEPGSLAILGYGNKVSAVAMHIGTLALGAVALPHFSLLFAKGDFGEIRRSFLLWVGFTAVIATTAAAILFIYSEPLVRAVYERGAFGPDSTVAVARVQAYYALQYPFYLVGLIAVRYLNAAGRNKLVLVSSLVNLLAKIGFNLLFIRWFGLPGIALATAAVYLCACVLLWLFVLVDMSRANKRSLQ